MDSNPATDFPVNAAMEEAAERAAPVTVTVARLVTFEEWCDLVGTTSDEMAEAQERHEEEERSREF